MLVLDNLNTHNDASLYQAFEPAEARRLTARLELVHTPKHGSWLNIAEIELGVLGRQCLARRIDEMEALNPEIAAWEHERNASQTGVDWQFTTPDARVKLKRLYRKVRCGRNTSGRREAGPCAVDDPHRSQRIDRRLPCPPRPRTPPVTSAR